jgi:hypothetical protein
MLKDRGIITNDNTKMTPQTEYEGRVLKFDFPDLGVIASELAWDAILSCFQGYDSSGDKI